MPDLTPIHIRGKRKAKPEEKWHYGKQRKLQHARPLSGRGSSMMSDLSVARPTDKRRRRKRHSNLSALEHLPTEILHAIFELSANPDLPLTSRYLASQLESSHHLHLELTRRVLYPVLDEKESSQAELQHALRLMNSRFFTYQFFMEWLRLEFNLRNLHQEWQDCVARADQSELDQEVWVACTWEKLRPNPNLPPPPKLLRGPFTEEKVRFLRYVSYTLSKDTAATAAGLDPVYLETAKEGLHQAVLENANEAVSAFWSFGLKPDTELLRKAVIDAGCDKDVVRSLVDRSGIQPPCIDYLDPALWAWAERARKGGDEEKGTWLMELLKDGARRMRRNEEKSSEIDKGLFGA